MRQGRFCDVFVLEVHCFGKSLAVGGLDMARVCFGNSQVTLPGTIHQLSETPMCPGSRIFRGLGIRTPLVLVAFFVIKWSIDVCICRDRGCGV